MTTLTAFADWLAASPLPPLVTSHDWLVPAIQVVHILAIAAVLIASVHINLRVLNVLESDVALADVAGRFLPILWGALGVLALILWALTVYAGRWIAYADPWPGAPG